MSRGSRIAIGVVALLCSLTFLFSAINPDSSIPAGPPVFYGLAILCFIIAIACFFPKSHPFTLRIIGATICVAYTAYLLDSIGSPNFFRALMGSFVFGIPSGYLAITGKSPTWDAISEGFKSKQNNDNDDNSSK
ncbi:hypothetical protein IQ249_18010 [Lusitaniella coriacea LEGE 07157]|uniref:Uncharacterized protein n=1 Tax=Lusitaniella coriacea LEGE 07157 TaxID=945747 RepID=A0A8J7IUP5_9CYAN|nr:hypothetical protein [Lusitaniella coriacea]MBE9117797.1 hypothetical protein [Lusitaniella coriacea LEGE 07157]